MRRGGVERKRRLEGIGEKRVFVFNSLSYRYHNYFLFSCTFSNFPSFRKLNRINRVTRSLDRKLLTFKRIVLFNVQIKHFAVELD